MHRNSSNVEDQSGKENTFIPGWMSEINFKNTGDFSSQPNVFVETNFVKEDVQVKKVLESDEEFVCRPEINAVIKRKKPNKKERGKTAEIKAAEINLASSGASTRKVLGILSGMVW